MKLNLKRKKKRHLLVTLIYRLNQIVPLGATLKFKLFLNLEWIFSRLAYEYSHRVYDPVNHPVRILKKAFIISGLDKSDKVLDVGCGHGEVSFYAADKAQKVVGVDYDSHSIDVASKRYQNENLNFLCCDAFDYVQQSTEKFQVLILSHILEHVEKPEVLLQFGRENFDKIYLEVPDFDFNYLNQYRQNLGLDLIYMDQDHVCEYDRDSFTELIEENGLKVTSSSHRYGVQRYWCEKK